MPDFPQITNPDYGLEEQTHKPQVRTEFESGHVQSRARATRERRRWRMSWQTLPDAEYQALAQFFTDNQGGSFAWTHPRTGQVFTARFSGDSLSARAAGPGYWQASLEIEEV